MRNVFVVWLSSTFKAGKVLNAIFADKDAAETYCRNFREEQGGEYHLEVEAYDLRDKDEIHP